MPPKHTGNPSVFSLVLQFDARSRFVELISSQDRNFDGVLQQFLQTCQLGDPVLNLGGVRVLMDVFWKLFTRRKHFMDTPTYMKSLDPEVSAKMVADNFYHVPFMESVVRVLTSLCIGRDSRAVRVTQDLIAKELLVTNEAAASRRRPEPECHENPWAEQGFTAETTHLGALRIRPLLASPSCPKAKL